MAGLCAGVGGSGNICGIITGGSCLIGMYAGRKPEEQEISIEQNDL